MDLPFLRRAGGEVGDQELWKMLIEQARSGRERSTSETPGAQTTSVSVTTGRTTQKATLLDIANRGCRFQSQQEFRAGARFDFELDCIPGREPLKCEGLRLTGRLVRVAGELDCEDQPIHSAAMLFDEALPETTRERLATLLNLMSTGADSFSQLEVAPIPACESFEIPGLQLDDEIDPPLRAGLPVELRLKPEPVALQEEESAERRAHDRGDFPQRILADAGGSERILIGRNISVGGMRVAGSPGLREGARFRLAIYGPAEIDPFLVSARVVRDEGEQGLAMRFEDVSDDVAEKLEKLVACLPQGRSLSESARVGEVISQILAEL